MEVFKTKSWNEKNMACTKYVAYRYVGKQNSRLADGFDFKLQLDCHKYFVML